MQSKRAIQRIVAFTGLCTIVLLASTAIGRAQSCNDQWDDKCTDHDGGHNSQYQCGASAGQYCRILVNQTGNTVTMVQKDHPDVSADYVCVVFGTIISWEEDHDNSSYVATFTPPAGDPYLFIDERLVFTGKKIGGAAVSDSDTVQHDPKPKQCNKYSISHHIIGQATVSSDPKVIVNGGGGGGNAH